MGSLSNLVIVSPNDHSTDDRFPISELHQVKRPDPEIKDASETEDNDDDDNDGNVDELDDDGGDKTLMSEEGSNDDMGDKNDDDDNEDEYDDDDEDEYDDDEDEYDDYYDDEDDEEEDEDEDDEEQHLQPLSKKRKHIDQRNAGSTADSCTKKASLTDRICRLLECLIERVESRNNELRNKASSKNCVQACSIRECIMRLDQLAPDIPACCDLYIWAVRMFMSKISFREAFCAFHTNEARRNWLEDEMRRSREGK